MSFSNAVSQVAKKRDQVRKNLLITRIKKDVTAKNRYFDGELCDLLLGKLGINKANELIGIQPRLDHGDVIVETWIKDHVQPEKFSSDLQFTLAAGFTVMGTHPVHTREVPVVVMGLPLDVEDIEVRQYFAKFGGKPSENPPQYLNYPDGPVKGYRNGERRYRVDFSGQHIQMGSFHFIKRVKVKITYGGNIATCGWCHESVSGCPGNVIASKCHEKGGQEVPLAP